MNKSDFKKLQKLWYKKLEKSGFNDIEKDEYFFKGDKTSTIDTRYGGPWESKAEYYIMATHFLNDYKFSSKLERIIWEYHSEGISTRNIALALNKIRRRYKKDAILRMTVWRIVKRLQHKMKQLYGVTT